MTIFIFWIFMPNIFWKSTPSQAPSIWVTATAQHLLPWLHFNYLWIFNCWSYRAIRPSTHLSVQSLVATYYNHCHFTTDIFWVKLINIREIIHDHRCVTILVKINAVIDGRPTTIKILHGGAATDDRENSLFCLLSIAVIYHF